MSKIVITNPAHEEVTQILKAWIDAVSTHIQGIPGTTHSVIELKNSDVTKDNFTNAVDSHSPGLILINGHGDHDVLGGYNNHPIIEVDPVNNIRFKDTIIHALACKAGKTLGPHLIEQGVKTFIGYEKNFEFYDLIQTGQDPLTDPVSSLYLEPAFEAPKLLAEGMTAEESYKEAQKMFLKSLRTAYSINMPQHITASLLSDYKHHVLLGVNAATI